MIYVDMSFSQQQHP